MYKIELIIQEDYTQEEAECHLEVHTVIDVGDESGLTVQGRIVSVCIRAEPRA